MNSTQFLEDLAVTNALRDSRSTGDIRTVAVTDLPRMVATIEQWATAANLTCWLSDEDGGRDVAVYDPADEDPESMVARVRLVAAVYAADRARENEEAAKAGREDAHEWASEGDLWAPVGDWDSEAFAIRGLPAETWESYQEAFAREILSIQYSSEE